MKLNNVIYCLFISIALCGCNGNSIVQSEDLVSHVPFQNSKDGRWGLIDFEGNVLIDEEFQNRPSVVMDGMFHVKNEKGLYEIYTADKKFKKIGNEYLSVGDFHSGLAPVVEKGEHVKYINKSGEIVSLSNLIDECEGISFRYSIDNIRKTLESQNIKYVDISSVIRMFKLRQDLIFPFEILIQRILLNGNIQYCIEQSLVADATALFPFWIIEKKPIDKENDENDLIKEPPQIDVGAVSLLSQKICEKLRGHDEFKKDFHKNLLKFFFLNRMGEQKILSIMLCGNSGIGKTQFAKFMSETMFPREPLIKINFGNYSTEGVLNSLIGSPLGYVGSEEGGELINKITKKKKKIILIDEFEKATPSVYNFFYELLEDGIFTDRHGIEHNLNGYIIVFTSNMTQSEYSKKIPDSLKSRFDMVYYFVDLPIEEKQQYIQVIALRLIEKLEKNFGKKVNIQDISLELSELSQYNNLRNIKKAVEDRVFNAFLDIYVDEMNK